MCPKAKIKLCLAAVQFLVVEIAFAQATEPQSHRLTPVPIQQVTVDDPFWSPKLKVWQAVTMQDCFAKFEEDGAFANFDRVRDGQIGGHGGPAWYDGLIYEMIRASADFLAAHPDPELEKQVNGYISRIAAAAAKDPNGYLETWTLMVEPNYRWGLNGGNDVAQHDIYNAGALVDGGVHWYRATGQTNLLQVAVRMANLMCKVMGPPPKANQVPGHSLGEEAMINLYLLFKEQPQLKAEMTEPVNEDAYLKLADFWIDDRGNFQGRDRKFGSYAQDDIPVCQQPAMEGHAVRDGLLCAGVTAAGYTTGREDYLAAAQRLWDNMAYCKMYLTGGLGAGLGIEGFGDNYYLPNKTAYAETCAAVAGGFFDLNMSMTFADAKYADALEREMFNGALAGVGLKGDSYYYENPLETDSPHGRWSWHPCPCCPPMFLKFMGALPGYLYAQEPGAVYVNQFVGSRASLTVNGSKVSLQQTTGYPWDGRIRITVNPEKANEFNLYIRIPGWCQGMSSSNDLYQIVGRPEAGAAAIKVNGHSVGKLDIVRGYARLHRQWKAGDVVELRLDMPVRQVRANPKVEADRGLVALMRGPIIYCAETVDNPGGLDQFVVSPKARFKAEFSPDLLGGVTVLQGSVLARSENAGKLSLAPNELTLVPFYANDNRGADELRVWLAASTDKAMPSTLAMRSRASASYCWHEDSVQAINDGIVPTKSSDTEGSRLSWWDHKGTAEWAELDLPQATVVSQVRVFWFADRPVNGGCDVPQNWVLLYKDGNDWKPVDHPSAYGLVPDRFNETTFTRIKTTALRIKVQLQAGWSGGILQWTAE